MNKRKIKIKDRQFEYNLKRRRGTRSLRLAIYPDGAFVVTAPKWYPMYIISRFLEEKAEWIYEKLKHVDFQELAEKKKIEQGRYKTSKNFARAVIEGRVKFFSQHYGFAYNRIAIKNQKSCWGSCSAKKNLNFNWKVAGLPEELRDYVIVHELCHLQELNHGEKFWKLVSEMVPRHKELRKKLRKQKQI